MSKRQIKEDRHRQTDWRAEIYRDRATRDTQTDRQTDTGDIVRQIV